tara:strand:- start:340 stop:1095 length:756 start_codon:yes stop_codon:yes gene_type:complete
MWWNIIKESRQTSRTVGSIDWENEAIPEENEEDDCKKWLKGLYDIMNKYQDIDYAYTTGANHSKQNVIKLDKIPENLACAIKDFYTENNAHEIDTNMVSLKPFFEKHGVDEKFIHDTFINTYLADYFRVEILIDSDDGIILNAGPSFSWDWDDGPFSELYDKTQNENEEKPYSKEVEERVKQFLNGKDKLTKRICDFIKEFSEYIKKPEIKDYLINYISWAWRNLHKINYGVKSINKETSDSFKIAVKQYF